MNPPTTLSTISIEELPSEMINELFKHLPPKDLVVCSLVNKSWHSIYAAFKLHRLVANSYHDFDRVLISWWDSNETIREAERCEIRFFFRSVDKPLLSNLKHLAIIGYKLVFDFNKLNRFSELVHLEATVNGVDGKAHLSLPKLRVLALHQFNRSWTLSIDCPLLSTLSYRSEFKEWQLEVKHPETIRKLETDIIDPIIATFKNVEILVAKKFEAISESTLIWLPALKELRYDKNIDRAFAMKSIHPIGTIDRMKRELGQFLEEAKRLKGSDFRFRFAGFQLTNVDMDQIDFGVRLENEYETLTDECAYMKYYHLIEPGALHFVGQIDYSCLLSHVTGEFPRCFSQKFTGIYNVWATAKVSDANHLLWFLKSLRTLRRLSLWETKLSQEFYDQLPASAHSLDSLLVEDRHCENGLQLNFDFIGKLPRISKLVINPLSYESLTSLVRSIGKLKEGSFAIRSTKEDFSISKVRGSKWKVRNQSNPLLFETENPAEIPNFFQEINRKIDLDESVHTLYA